MVWTQYPRRGKIKGGGRLGTLVPIVERSAVWNVMVGPRVGPVCATTNSLRRLSSSIDRTVRGFVTI